MSGSARYAHSTGVQASRRIDLGNCAGSLHISDACFLRLTWILLQGGVACAANSR